MAPAVLDTPALAARLIETIKLLESIASDRSVLEHLPEEDRVRLLRAIASVHHPDRIERRRKTKAVARERRAAHVARVEAARAATGIQTLRRKKPVHSPNVFPPAFAPSELRRDQAGAHLRACPYIRCPD